MAGFVNVRQWAKAAGNPELARAGVRYHKHYITLLCKGERA